jgi:hypothetical protein
LQVFVHLAHRHEGGDLFSVDLGSQLLVWDLRSRAQKE